MNKFFAVLKREYLQAVRKKMFIVMTFLLPFLMAGLFLLPGLMIARGIGGKKVVVVDGTGKLGDAFRTGLSKIEVPDPKEAMTGKNRNTVPSQLDLRYVDAGAQNVDGAAKPYLERLRKPSKDSEALDAVLLVPAPALNDSEAAHLTFYSRSSTDLVSQERLARIANKAIQRYRLTARGLNPAELDRLTQEVPLEAVQISKSGEQKKGGEANFFVGFIFAALLILPSFVYGVEIMRGIIQEKNERIVEILVSSMSPIQLLSGKILGLALVGLTQITAWIVMGLLIGGYGAATAAMAGFNVMQFLKPMIFVWFAIFFVLAYLTYVCVYAVAGASCNSDKEAQQMVAPISMFMMIPWFLAAPIIMNPESKLAVGLSLSPVFAPMTMFIRTIVSDPPATQIALAILSSMATVAVFFWATAKIFRVGILSYGKRPTIPELLRWVRVA